MATLADLIGRWTPPPQGTTGGAGSGFAGTGRSAARRPLTPIENKYLNGFGKRLYEEDTACSSDCFQILQELTASSAESLQILQRIARMTDGLGNRTAVGKQQYGQCVSEEKLPDPHTNYMYNKKLPDPMEDCMHKYNKKLPDPMEDCTIIIKSFQILWKIVCQK